MHILADHYRSEFLACPQLVRFDYARGASTFEPTLLIKGSTLLLKYIIAGVRMQLVFTAHHDRILYGLKIYDDHTKPAVLWSILEYDQEKQAVAGLFKGEPCQVFLFNEVAANVAYAAIPIKFTSNLLERLLIEAKTGRVDHSLMVKDVDAIFDRIHVGDLCDEVLIVDISDKFEWKPILNHFITNGASDSLLNIFDKDEGNQQEQISIWLTDNLHPGRVYHSPKIPKGKGLRELTDILLSHEFGTILIESKALAIFARNSLPNRSKLASDVADDITKAVRQLRGGMRRLKDGTPVTDGKGIEIEVERTKPMHGIVLIPDFELIEDRTAYGLPFIMEFMKATGGFLHILDTAELLRIVQAAEMITTKESGITLMVAFDYYLLERVKKTVEAQTLCIEVLLRFA